MSKTLILTFVLTACAAITAMSQNPSPQTENGSPVMDRIVNKIKAREPGWRHEHKYSGTGYSGVRFHEDDWLSGNEDLSVTVQEFSSPVEAGAEMHRAAEMITMGFPKKLKGLGDDATIWEDYNGRGRTTLHLRRKNVVVFINASSVGVARRFARHIVDGLADN